MTSMLNSRRITMGPQPRHAWIGIDPGLDGGVAWIDDRGLVLPFPTPTKPTGKGSGRDFDLPTMREIILHGPEVTMVFAAIEEVNAAPMRGRRQGTTSMFTFGRGYGIWLGMLATLGIEAVTVPPKKWKSAILRGLGTDKAAAIAYVQRFHPSVNLRATARCRTDHDGMADAVCLADYARREWRTRQLLGR